MSYTSALEAAGAKVILYNEFGSYQGDWFAKVNIAGNLHWVQGAYGSCHGCDAFQAEFDWDDDGYCEEHKEYSYHNDEAERDKVVENCAACQEALKKYKEHLVEFGKRYLNDLWTQEEAEAYASENVEWDVDAQEMLDWLKENKI